METEPRDRFIAREVVRDDAPLLVRLFEESGSTCYCRYWHFEGDKNEWLDRMANQPIENRSELDRGVETDSPDTRGVIALSDAGEIAGWLKLSQVSDVIKMYQQRYYRSLPCFNGNREGAYVIGCILVHPRHRRRGVARALVSEAVKVAEKRGAKSIEALPRRALERVTDEELWMGPLNVFQSLGFAEVHRTTELQVGQADPYPVLRFEIPRRNG